MCNPTPTQAKHLNHLLQYLAATTNKQLEIEPTSASGLEIFSDSNFADASDPKRRSTSGTVVTYHGRPVLWKSKLQTCTADSTHEAELYAVHQSLKLGLGIRLSLIELLELNPTVTTPMFVDNAATVQTSKLKDQISNNNRHIDTRFFKICDHVETGEITVLWCPRGRETPPQQKHQLGQIRGGTAIRKKEMFFCSFWCDLFGGIWRNVCRRRSCRSFRPAW